MDAILAKTQKVLVDLVSDVNSVPDQGGLFPPLDWSELAHLYILNSLLGTFSRYKLDHFKKGKVGDSSAEGHRVHLRCLANEYGDLLFLSQLLAEGNREKTDQLIKRSERLQEYILEQLHLYERNHRIAFHQTVLKKMSVLFQTEFEMPGIEINLYRSFDSLDGALGLDYSEERKMPIESANVERIFSGSAESVQSSYSTIFSVLREAQPKNQARVIDLGCGFGRLGLVIGLYRPDMKFIGYEYVDHRVQTAKNCALDLHLNKNIQFYTQDLSDRNFQLPRADIYYMYDPFNESTYRFILEQIVQISKVQKVLVVTKGHAKDWLLEISNRHSWQPVKSFDYGNLNLFASA